MYILKICSYLVLMVQHPENVVRTPGACCSIIWNMIPEHPGTCCSNTLEHVAESPVRMAFHERFEVLEEYALGVRAAYLTCI